MGIVKTKSPRLKGVIGERDVPYAFCRGGRTISGRGKHPLLRYSRGGSSPPPGN